MSTSERGRRGAPTARDRRGASSARGSTDSSAPRRRSGAARQSGSPRANSADGVRGKVGKSGTGAGATSGQRNRTGAAPGDRRRDDARQRTSKYGDGGRRPARSNRLPRDAERFQDPRSGSSDLPPVPEHADVSLLDRSVRAELRSLSKPNADAVGRHLVAAGEALDSDPTTALAHARAARARAARVGAVREAVGLAAYHAGEWSEALTELRTARRISGDPHSLPLIADCERALGRPDRALRALNDPNVGRLDAETRIELFIVVAGARRDLGQLDAALAVLARGGLDRDRPRPGSARLWYAYADTLEAAGRAEEAASWFAASAAADVEGELDAADRAGALL